MSLFRLFLLCATVIAAAVMELIDTSIVNVALSHMSRNLGATLVDTSWVIMSYAIANIIIIPITSFLAAMLLLLLVVRRQPGAAPVVVSLSDH